MGSAIENFQPPSPTVGEQWVYRHRDDAPSERVLVHDVTQTKRKVRVEVEFLDGPQAGARHAVPGGRLRVPWSEVEAFDQLMSVQLAASEGRGTARRGRKHGCLSDPRSAHRRARC